MAGGEPRLGTTATYMRHNDHGTTRPSTEIDRLHDRTDNEYRIFSAGSVRKWSKFGLSGRCVPRYWGMSDARWGCEDRRAVQLCELRSARANGSSVAGYQEDSERGAGGAVAGGRDALCQSWPAGIGTETWVG